MHSLKNVQRPIGILTSVLIAVLLSSVLFAQTDTGRILGTVFDQTGAVVPSATVTITDADRGTTRTLTTNEAGEYQAPNLIAGTYIVRATAMGFKNVERRNIGLEVAKDVRIDVTLQPGDTTTTVTITAEAPLVDNTSAVLGGTLSNQLILDLPVQGRNFQKLLELRPGTYLAPGSGKWSLSSNGMRREHNVYILNGMDTVEGFSSQSVVNATPIFGDATSIVPIDAIQEFNTQQVPKAEYGWKPGAVVNVGLRSGNNTLHGTAYAFGRSDSLDARNPFIQAGTPKQVTEIEDFGGTVGGPIKHDKLFFLLGYEGQRNTIGAPSGSLTLPTRAAIGNPAQSVLDACNALPAGTPPKDLSLKMAGLVYNGPGHCGRDSANTGVFQDRNTVSYSVAPIGTANLHNGLAKIDYHLNSKHTISGEYFVGNYEGLGPQNNAAAQDYWSTFTHAKSMVMGAHWTWVPTSTIVNELRGGFNRENQLSYPGDCVVTHPDYGYLANMNSNSSLTGAGLPANCGFPVITITGFSATGCCGTFPKIQGPDWTQQVVDNLSYFHGRHSLKFGAEGRRLAYSGGTYSGSRGSFTFTNLTTFLTGTVNAATPPAVLVGQPARSLSEFAWAGFVQDDWRITNTFTVNYGVRYETVTPIKDANNQLANFDPTSPTGLVQIGHGLNQLWRRTNDWSPRLGFAWDIGGKGKWVVRGGASMIYVLEGFNVFVSQQGVSAIGVNAIPTGALLGGVQGPGNITTASVQFTSGVNWSIAGPVLPGGSTVRCDSPLNATPAGANKPCSITAVDPNLRRPYAPSWNFSVQHAFSNNMSLQVAYVGSHGIGLVGLNDINRPLPGSGWLTGATCNTPYTPAQIVGAAAAASANCENLNRPYFGKFPYLSNINYISNQDFSNYNGLQVTLTQRPWHGLSYLVGYTWAHALDEAGGDWNGAGLPANLFNVRQDYASSADDVRHRMTASVSYALPEKKGFAQLLEGWKINSVVNVQTALPWTVTDATDDISGVGGKVDGWNFYGNPSAFSGLGYANVPYFAGTTSPDCVSKAASLDSNRTPLYPGYTYSSSLAKYGCYASGGSMLLAPAIGSYGTGSRNLFRGRGLKLMDVSLTKDVKFSERFGGQFRFEVFNILNKTQYTPTVNGNPASRANPLLGSSRTTPDVQISNPEVGSGAARSIQLGFKLQF